MKRINKSQSASKKESTFERVYQAVMKIPRGKVSTYGAIADYTGIKNPRVIGYALHANKNPDKVPCHRVVNIKGEFAKGYVFGGSEIQKQLLSNEGIKFTNDKVDLSKYQFEFS